MLLYILMVALCTACISYTICCTSIFLWLRELVSPIHPKIEELIHCPYCLSHYIVLTIMLLTDNTPVYSVFPWYVCNFILTLFVIVGVVSLFHFVMVRAYKPVAEYMVDRQLAKRNKR